MANFKFSCIKKSNPSNLNIRFYHGRNIDCNAQSHILINPSDWSEKMQNFKPNTDITIKSKYNPLIEDLKKEILGKFNIEYSNGVIINSKWLKKIIQDFHKRPEGIEEFKIYFVSFIEKFIEDSKARRNPVSGKKIAENTIKKYITTLNKIKEFEKVADIKLKITDVNLDFHNKITHYLKEDLKYSNTFIAKVISQVKLFVREAKEKRLETNPDIESKNSLT
ncbi:phage integrase SAM-like domain-containing protein [Chryseobacterium chendengshani]|uniref:phage integrase SAM-like domain-containing protein n=1 Tax=Chryseobacterium sp. LJ668 TaxID=2864040 RepID=UPI001C68DF7B|nr:phage integrase SAM-like domain-containing protein [Chryseobacterium sp. LJ668]MBW8522167.1 phage integrase SAM-like domain-containing protein [Chryseobacterium sp. LJ668]QYK17813.1 phage integrase SAM-like domain-containing protein [Chryseobacterium sp. LJ668]